MVKRMISLLSVFAMVMLTNTPTALASETPMDRFIYSWGQLIDAMLAGIKIIYYW
jgi:hypothetical protein